MKMYLEVSGTFNSIPSGSGNSYLNSNSMVLAFYRDIVHIRGINVIQSNRAEYKLMIYSGECIGHLMVLLDCLTVSETSLNNHSLYSFFSSLMFIRK